MFFNLQNEERSSNDLSKQDNTQQELAYELFKKGYKYKEIAEEVNCSVSAVKSWATRYWKKVAEKGCNQILKR